MHMERRTKNTTPILGTGRGLGRRLNPAEKGSGRESDIDRQREEETPGRENPGDEGDLGTG